MSETEVEPGRPERPEHRGIAGHNGVEGSSEAIRTSGRPGSSDGNKLPSLITLEDLENVMDSSGGFRYRRFRLEDLDNLIDINYHEMGVL